MRLVNIYDYPEQTRLDTLWELLKERKPHTSISHKKMPSRENHEQFVEGKPYAVWYFICPDENLDMIYGSIYLTNQREIGIQMFEKCQGYGGGTKAVKELMNIHKGPYFANISPKNEASMQFFEGLGFKHVQNTFRL